MSSTATQQKLGFKFGRNGAHSSILLPAEMGYLANAFLSCTAERPKDEDVLSE
ncbi:hypothetical protein [Halopseudomonas pelagia]|uniref:hypothetical protein n=1 Tax=Halopseudomonas pelagia TaxID=553151 RepID=UPI0030DC64C3|tara:strand:- start:11638 stop:11796 length:159 start_codon:yes stop_codon:yes gene_type:complete